MSSIPQGPATQGPSESTAANNLSNELSTVPVPFDENDAGHREVMELLDRCKLSQYLSVFITEGFDSLKSLCEVSEDDMIAMKVKRGHRRLIQREIATVKGIPRHQPLWISFTAPATVNTIDPRIGQLRLVQRPPGSVWINTGNGDGNSSSSSGSGSGSRSLDFSSGSLMSSSTSLTAPPKPSCSANADSSSSASPSKAHVPVASQTQLTTITCAAQVSQVAQQIGQSEGARQVTGRYPVSAVEDTPNNKASGSSNDDDEDDEEDNMSSSTRQNDTTTMTLMPPKRKYKKRPKADKNAPVKPPSAYVMFSNDTRAQLKDQNLSFAQLAKIVGERWKRLSREEKLSYETAAVVAKDQYHAALEQYRKTPEYRKHQEYLREFKSKQEAVHKLLAKNARKRSKAGSPSSGSLADCSSNGNSNGNGSSGSSGSADSYDGNGNDSNDMPESYNRNKVQDIKDRRNKGKSRLLPRHSTGNLPLTVFQYRESYSTTSTPDVATESGSGTTTAQQSETNSSGAAIERHYVSSAAFPEMVAPVPGTTGTVIAKIPGTTYTQGNQQQQQQQGVQNDDEQANNNNDQNTTVSSQAQ